MPFSIEETEMLRSLAFALPPSQRASFLTIVADKLAALPLAARGVGMVYRVASETQKDFLRSGPIAVGKVTKYSRSQQPSRQGRRGLIRCGD
jgi:hypothetical protein